MPESSSSPPLRPPPPQPPRPAAASSRLSSNSNIARRTGRPSLPAEITTLADGITRGPQRRDGAGRVLDQLRRSLLASRQPDDPPSELIGLVGRWQSGQGSEVGRASVRGFLRENRQPSPPRMIGSKSGTAQTAAGPWVPRFRCCMTPGPAGVTRSAGTLRTARPPAASWASPPAPLSRSCPCRRPDGRSCRRPCLGVGQG
jgi:hypothetical protein